MASEAAAMLGKSPYMSKRKLAEIKRGISAVSINPAMQRGTDYEPEARAAVEAHFGKFFAPKVIELGAYGASLDGINDEGTLIEIKVPQSAESGLWVAAGLGEIPDHYQYQLCQQVAVSSASEAHFCVYLPGVGLRVIEYQYSAHTWDEIRQGWDAFWVEYMSGDLPEDERSDEEWHNAADAFLAAKKSSDDAAEKLEAARKALIELAPAGAKGYGVSVTKSTREGAIAWSKAIKALKLDPAQFESYRGNPSTYYTVK
jgi:putative phage-type endonuclease